MIKRKLDLTLMSLSMFYKILHHLLPLATAADPFVQQAVFFLSVFTYCQLTLEPDFLLIYVLQMNFIGSSSVNASVYTFHKSSTGLASFDGLEFNADDDDDDDDDDEEAVDEVAPLLDDDSWSSLNELAYTVNDKGFADAEPPHI